MTGFVYLYFNYLPNGAHFGFLEVPISSFFEAPSGKNI
jgi:hypothetical protein